MSRSQIVLMWKWLLANNLRSLSPSVLKFNMWVDDDFKRNPIYLRSFGLRSRSQPIFKNVSEMIIWEPFNLVPSNWYVGWWLPVEESYGFFIAGLFCYAPSQLMGYWGAYMFYKHILLYIIFRKVKHAVLPTALVYYWILFNTFLQQEPVYMV